jgi:hypothetical protein
MRPGADEIQIIALDLVDEQPVGLDVAVAMMTPLASERVILIPGRQRRGFNQQQDDLPQSRHILAAFLREFHIAPELGAGDRAPQRSDPQVFEEFAARS